MPRTKGSFRPRRAKRATAIEKEILLKKGEILFEVPETGVGTGAGKIVMGDGVTPYADLPYFSEGGGSGSGTVQFVNNIGPDDHGNVDLKQVPYAENLLSPDNIIVNDDYIFRTSGGTADIESGDAYLDKIQGNCIIDNDTIYVATPTSFKSTGLNSFDKSTMILEGYTINSLGNIAESEGKYVAFVHAVGGLTAGYIAYSEDGYIERIGWSENIPTTSTTGIYISPDVDHVTSITYNEISSVICAVEDGYICIACSDIDDLVVHPKWTGIADTEQADYSASTISIPTVDVNDNALPTSTYGFPSIGDVRDEINFAQLIYIQRIGHYEYTEANLDTVEAMGVEYIYDNTNIFYVLPNPTVYKLKDIVSGKYIVNDFGTEEFVGTSVPVVATSMYGANLRDKLRHDVVTISPQELTTSEQAQVCENIGAASETLINPVIINGETETTINGAINALNDTFTGTTDDWNDLDLEEKLQYTIVNITDDDSTESFGTAAYMDATDVITALSTELVEAGAVYSALNDKVDKIDGKGLSTNDYDTTEKIKVTNAQPSTLSSSIIIGGVTKTTVEDALNGLNTTKSNKEEIAEVESTNIAVSAHNTGSYFINSNEKFVKATSDISIGGSISGSNTSETNVANELKIFGDILSIGLTHNGIFRGKYLGEITSNNIDNFLAEHEVSTGKFTDLYLGDYFTIMDGTHNTDWMVAGLDHFYNKGGNFTIPHHITLIPRTYLNYPQSSSDHLCPMNSTDTTGVSKNTSNPLYVTTGGNETAGYQAYYGSDMCQIYLPAIASHLQQALGNHLKATDYLVPISMNMSGISKNEFIGYPNNWNWLNSATLGLAILPTEVEIYGCNIWSGGNFDTGLNCQKLPVFNFIPYNYYSRTHFWLRSVVSSSNFALAHFGGLANYYSASDRFFLRPLINIG